MMIGARDVSYCKRAEMAVFAMSGASGPTPVTSVPFVAASSTFITREKEKYGTGVR
jgi:hypothetical protein